MVNYGCSRFYIGKTVPTYTNSLLLKGTKGSRRADHNNHLHIGEYNFKTVSIR